MGQSRESFVYVCVFFIRWLFSLPTSQHPGVCPYPLGAGSARPNPKSVRQTQNPLFIGFTAPRGGLRPWSQTMVSEGARSWGRGRSEFAQLLKQKKGKNSLGRLAWKEPQNILRVWHNSTSWQSSGHNGHWQRGEAGGEAGEKKHGGEKPGARGSGEKVGREARGGEKRGGGKRGESRVREAGRSRGKRDRNGKELSLTWGQRNRLQGTLPEILGKLTSAWGLQLDENRLKGSTPDSAYFMRSMHLLALSYNLISGSVPEAVTRSENQAEKAETFLLEVGAFLFR